MDVIDLDARRSAVRPGRCRCGCEWFVLRGRANDPSVAEHGAVTLDSDGNITGYCGAVICTECQEPWFP